MALPLANSRAMQAGMHRVISRASRAGAQAREVLACLLWVVPATSSTGSQHSRPAWTCLDLTSFVAIPACTLVGPTGRWP